MFKIRPSSSLKKYFTPLIGVTFLTVNASAQTDMTARERVLDYVASTSHSTTSSAILTQPAIITNPVTDIDMPIADKIMPIDDFSSEIITTLPAPSPTTPAPSSIVQEGLTDAERENSIVRDLSQIELSQSGGKQDSFAFFTSARDYLAQRGQFTGPRLTLRYDVTRKNASTAAIGLSSIVDIIIGTDYAAISKSSDEIVIYDFKENRLLNVSRTSNTFTNASLYAAAYRAFDTVGKMTNGGEKRELTLGANVTLDAFYLESALGYAAGPPPRDLLVIQEDKKITADFTGKNAISERVFSAMLNGPKLEDYRQAFSFIGLLYHSEPVHPSILAELKEVRAAPNAMTFHSFGPKIPDGEIISWTLKSQMSEIASFPLPADAKSVVENEAVSPLNFVMSEAITGRALGGQVDPNSALTVIKQQIQKGDILSAWISAQSLKDMMGGCEMLVGLCKAIFSAESKKDSDIELSALILALSQTEIKSTRIEGLKTLLPMITANDAPSLVLRRAGLAVAKTTPAQRETAGLGQLDAAKLLSQAIARNPYDLLAYQGLARLRAARGDFIGSWNINDALRAFTDVPETLRAPIDRAEAKLESAAPGFFPPVDP